MEKVREYCNLSKEDVWRNYHGELVITGWNRPLKFQEVLVIVDRVPYGIYSYKGVIDNLKGINLDTVEL